MATSSSRSTSSSIPSSSACIQSARDEIKSLFRTRESLARLGVQLDEVSRKQAAVEAQLTAAVRTQVDETRVGLQMLGEASNMMKKMRQNFLAIDQYCKDAKLVLRDSPEIHEVNTARRNLEATTRLLQRFRSLPAQAEQLVEELNADDRAIKTVYKKLRALFRLRDSAMEADVGLNRVGGAASPSPSSTRSGAGTGTGAGTGSDLHKQLARNFSELSRSSNIIEEQIWMNLSDAAYLAKEDPTTLVLSLEVIEMEDRATRKVLGLQDEDEEEEEEEETKRADEDEDDSEEEKESKKSGKKKKDGKKKNKGDKAGSSKTAKKPTSSPTAQPLPSPSASIPHVSMREKCKRVLEESIADLFNHLHIDEEQSLGLKRKAAEEKAKKQQALEEYKRKLRIEEEERWREMRRAEGLPDRDELDDAGADVDEPFEGGGDMSGGGLLFAKVEDEPALMMEEEDAQHQPERDPNAPSDYILSILEELTTLVEGLPDTLEHMIPCFPPDYHLAHFFIESYMRWLKLTIAFHTDDVAKLTKKALLKTVNWIEWYRGEIKKWEKQWPGSTQPQPQTIMPPSAPTSTSTLPAAVIPKGEDHSEYYDRLVRNLMHAYTQTVESTLLKLCDNILANEERAEAEVDMDGFMRTNGPSDLFFTINSTIEIVLGSFGPYPKPLSYVSLMVADVFTYVQNVQLKFLQSVELEEEELYFNLSNAQGRIHKSDSYFAALINNCSTSQEHMDELKEKILARLSEAEGIETAAPLHGMIGTSSLSSSSSSGQVHRSKTLLEQMEDAFEEAGEGFVAVASEGIDLLVLQITVTLQKPCANLFTPLWIKDDATTQDIVLTLQDFFDDYSKWIDRSAYFGRVVSKSLQSLMSEYLRKLLELKPSVSKELFERMKQDRQILQQFFMQYARGDDDSGAGGAGGVGLISPQTVKSELALLKVVNKIIHEDPDFMSVHFEAFQARFGGAAREVMEGLIAMRTDLSKAQRKEIMEKFIQQLPASYAADQSSHRLQQQLVNQNLQSLASPKSGSSGASSSGSKGLSGVVSDLSARGFWEIFKNREKKSGKSKPSSFLHRMASKRSGMDEEHGQSVSSFIE